MKKLFFLLISSAMLLVGCSTKPAKTIVLTNDTDADRVGVMVEVCAMQLGLNDADLAAMGLFDAAGEQIPFQVMHYGAEEAKCIVFLADIPAMQQVQYTLKSATPLVCADRVSARFVPERKDDFAWENDCAAYRMYGPALAPENPSNGIDLWLKKTEALIVDTFYYREHVMGLPYHVDYGKGLDCYKVGHTAGCGGVFPIVDGLPQIGNHYDSWEIIDRGPLRVVFRLTYDNYFADADRAPVQQTYTVTCDAGQPLCRAEVVYTPTDSSSRAFTEIGAGIFLHTATANPAIELGGNQHIGCCFMAYAENAVSDAGLPAGRNYVGVVLPGMKATAEQDAMLYGTADYEMGETYTYYFGGGWSEWKFPTDEDWFAQVAAAASLVANPIQVSVE